jgi:hypothetical protein
LATTIAAILAITTIFTSVAPVLAPIESVLDTV